MTNSRTLKSNKPAIQIGVNLALSFIAIYVFEFWIKRVIALPMNQAALNIASVILTLSMFFVGKTFYDKGLANNLKKASLMILLGGGAIVLMLLSSTKIEDIAYPFGGFILASIVFYMVSLSTVTINLTGMIGIFMLLLIPVAFLVKFQNITIPIALELSEFIAFSVLFFGGTWAEIRAFLHGIRGVNNDGSGYNGDPSDGDNDTGDE